MDSIIVINLILVVIFIGLTAFFVGAEFAILKVRGSRIDQLIAEGNKKAVLAKKVTSELDYYLSACQLGITITALVLGALGEPTVEKLLHPLFESWNVPAAVATFLSYLIALLLVSFLHVVFGELMPKTLAIQFAEKMSLALAGPLYWFGRLTNPIIVALNGSSQILLKMIGIKPSGHENVHSEEEIKWIVDQSYESGEINKTELEYINNIFKFDERVLKEIMIPTHKIVTLPADLELSQVVIRINQNDYTRYPIVEDGEYKGFINTKEMLTAIAMGKAASIKDMLRELPQFLDQTSIREVLLKMQQNQIHIGIVKDSSGAAVGLITMEDILEEIVGDIKNETYR